MTGSATLFFILSKILGFFAEPSNLLIILGLVGALLLRTSYLRAARRLLVSSFVLLAVFGLTPLGHALILPLEERFSPWDASRGAPDGIIVLGGGIEEMASSTRSDSAVNEASDRITAVVELARRYPQARILYSGATGALVFSGSNEAEAARRLFAQLGVAAERVEVEDQSRNTIENAIMSKDIAHPQPGQRWLLVTSAFHMPRSVGIFRKVGFPVEAYPVDYRTRGWIDLWRPFRNSSEGLRRTDLATREWVGLLIYWLTGRSSEFFPGPGGR